MRTFYEYLSDLDLLSRLWLIETYYSFDPAQYNQLFDGRIGEGPGIGPIYSRQGRLKTMRGFNWVGYIARSVRNAGLPRTNGRCRSEPTIFVTKLLHWWALQGL